MQVYRNLVQVKVVQVAEMKTRLEGKIEAMEEERNTLLEEIRKLKDIAELSEKAKGLEDEVSGLRDKVKTLKDKIPQEFLEELEEATPMQSSEEDELGEESSSCEEEDLL